MGLALGTGLAALAGDGFSLGWGAGLGAGLGRRGAMTAWAWVSNCFTGVSRLARAVWSASLKSASSLASRLVRFTKAGTAVLVWLIKPVNSCARPLSLFKAAY